jgi:hypothetical protein
MKKRILCIILFLSSLLIYFNCNGDLLEEGPEATTATTDLDVKLRGIWIIGGASTYAGGTFYTEIDLYDPVTSTWYPNVTAGATGTAPGGLAFPMVVSVNSKIYVMGGATTTTVTTSAVYEYDILNNSWTVKAPINYPTTVSLMDAAAYAHGGKIYLMGGTSTTTAVGVVATHYLYNPADDTWTTRLVVPTGRCGMAVYNDDGLVSYALGRIITTGAPQTTNDIYMLNQNVYTTANPAITEQVFTAVFGAAYAGYSGSNGTYFFIVGGATNTIATYFGMASLPTYITSATSWQVYTPPASASGILVAQNSTYYHPSYPAVADTTKGIVFAAAAVSPYRSGSSAINPTLYVFGGIKNQSTVTDDYYYLSANGTVPIPFVANYIVTSAWTGDNSGATKMPRVRYGHRAVTINQ